MKTAVGHSFLGVGSHLKKDPEVCTTMEFVFASQQLSKYELDGEGCRTTVSLDH